MKKHLPILMSAAMAIATEEEIKTMTRRMRGLKGVNLMPLSDISCGGVIRREGKEGLWGCFQDKKSTGAVYVKCPYGQIGDRLYVRENFRMVAWDFEEGEVTLEYTDGSRHTFYDGDLGVEGDVALWTEKQIGKLSEKGYLLPDPNDEERMVFSLKPQPWTPSIHLPKWGSRIWLCILDVKLERLHSITTADIKSEGVMLPVNEKTGNILYALGEDNSAASFLPPGSLRPDVTPPTEDEIWFAHWAELWCKINGRQSWDSNPWVWVVKFKKVDAPNIVNP